MKTPDPTPLIASVILGAVLILISCALRLKSIDQELQSLSAAAERLSSQLQDAEHRRMAYAGASAASAVHALHGVSTEVLRRAEAAHAKSYKEAEEYNDAHDAPIRYPALEATQAYNRIIESAGQARRALQLNPRGVFAYEIPDTEQ